VPQDHKVYRAYKEFKEQLDPLEQLDHKEILALKDPLVHRVQPEQPDPLVPQDHKVSPEQLVRRVTRVDSLIPLTVPPPWLILA
jgi:hypothetical protein